MSASDKDGAVETPPRRLPPRPAGAEDAPSGTRPRPKSKSGVSVAEPGARPRRMSQPWVEVVDAADAPESTERPAPGVAAVTADAITPSQPGLEARLLAPVDAASSTAVPALSHEPQSLADLALPDEPERAEEGDEAEDEGPDPYLGSVISDRYVVDELIGEGGMG
ncbi:MAG: hypothetical protein KC731_41310, partial [Myxococcales bacterium]|nr:hypothetical protein [Myxococcales bacterium]